MQRVIMPDFEKRLHEGHSRYEEHLQHFAFSLAV